MKTPLETYLDSGVDFEARRIFLLGDIDDNDVNVAIKAFYGMRNSTKPIELILHSFGGCTYSMLALYDVIQGMPSEVTTIGHGAIMSATLPLLVCGDRRVCSPHTSFMTHSVSGEESGKYHQLKKSVEQVEVQNKMMCRVLEKHTKLTYRHWWRLISRNYDYYFTAEEALEFGVVDEIVGD